MHAQRRWWWGAHQHPPVTTSAHVCVLTSLPELRPSGHPELVEAERRFWVRCIVYTHCNILQSLLAPYTTCSVHLDTGSAIEHTPLPTSTCVGAPVGPSVRFLGFGVPVTELGEAPCPGRSEGESTTLNTGLPPVPLLLYAVAVTCGLAPCVELPPPECCNAPSLVAAARCDPADSCAVAMGP